MNSQPKILLCSPCHSSHISPYFPQVHPWFCTGQASWSLSLPRPHGPRPFSPTASCPVRVKTVPAEVPCGPPGPWVFCSGTFSSRSLLVLTQVTPIHWVSAHHSPSLRETDAQNSGYSPCTDRPRPQSFLGLPASTAREPPQEVLICCVD